MNEAPQEILFDLLAKKAVYGLDVDEQRQLDNAPGSESESHSLDLTAAAISLAGMTRSEELPRHLYSKIAADAEQYIGTAKTEQDAVETPWPPIYKDVRGDDHGRGSSWSGWLGWAVAAAACVALAAVIWLRPAPQTEQAVNNTVIQPPMVRTPAQEREEMMRSTPGIIKANWAAGNVKDVKDISGDVVWSDQKQAGYMRLRGLPANDPAKATYQLWIFDKTQDKATPIDGGTFDVPADGEVVIPINAKLKAQEPQMFAITMERPGGVVVSKREKIAALAKVETQAG